jgi:hypothetical protein
VPGTAPPQNGKIHYIEQQLEHRASLKQLVEINSNVGKILRGDFTVPLEGYLVMALS